MTDTTTRALDNGATITVITLDGVDHTDNAGLQTITGRSRTRLAALEAEDDEGFPTRTQPGPGTRGRAGAVYYRLDQAHAYAHRLDAERVVDTGDGDPDELLNLDQVRQTWPATADGELKTSTMRQYAQKSRLAWAAGDTGILPVPDAGYDPKHPADSSPKHWRWRRDTIAAHGRIGIGAPGRKRG